MGFVVYFLDSNIDNMILTLSIKLTACVAKSVVLCKPSGRGLDAMSTVLVAI